MNLLHESDLTVREVAELFRIGNSTVYSWISEGAICAVQIGGSWRIPQSQFEHRAVGASPALAEDPEA